MHHKSTLRTILQPLGIAVALALLVRAAVLMFSITSQSMLPTLAVGDRIVVTRYLTGRPDRGHVIVFASPRNPEELLVKRVVGVPGDLVDARLGRLRIGGYSIPEPYLLHPAATGAVQAQVVPGDSYFVLGDNRAESSDSRTWGCVPAANVVGRARLVLWSAAPEISQPVQAATDGTPGAVRSSRSRRLFKWIE
jgi:signal peptidase I